LIDDTLTVLRKVSNKALFGIANHSDARCNIELHVIKEDIKWWTIKLSKFYSGVNLVGTLYEDAFFFIETGKGNQYG
jgi:hypothetical protein